MPQKQEHRCLQNRDFMRAAALLNYFFNREIERMAYDHGAFRVRNLDDAIAFYTGKLGFRFLFDGKNEKAAERYAFLDHNGARLELIETEHETYRPSTPEHPFCPHLCFEAENMDSVLKMLRENELTILDGPNEIPNSEQWIYFADPDMNVLEYIVWLDKKRE